MKTFLDMALYVDEQNNFSCEWHQKTMEKVTILDVPSCAPLQHKNFCWNYFPEVFSNLKQLSRPSRSPKNQKTCGEKINIKKNGCWALQIIKLEKG